MMELVRRSNSTPGLSTFDEMDKLFDNFWRGFSLPTFRSRLPSVDIYSEDEKNMMVEMQTPGYDQKDIQINVENGILEISAERASKEEDKSSTRNYMVRESAERFSRRIALPKGADVDNISAKLDKGLLKISVPVEKAEAKRIQVKTEP